TVFSVGFKGKICVALSAPRCYYRESDLTLLRSRTRSSRRPECHTVSILSPRPTARTALAARWHTGQALAVPSEFAATWPEQSSDRTAWIFVIRGSPVACHCRILRPSAGNLRRTRRTAGRDRGR